jgi:hypothetical protein
VALDRWDATRSRLWAATSGLALGAAVLTREMMLYFLPVVLVWMLVPEVRPHVPDVRRHAGRAVRDAVLLVAVVAVVVLPWTARNYALHRRVVLVSTLQWFAIALGNLLPESNWVFAKGPTSQFRREYLAIPDELQREAFAREIALQAIRSEQPGWIFKKIGRNTYQLFSPSRTQLSRFAAAGWLAPGTDGLARRLALVEAAFYIASMSAGIAAFWLVPGGRVRALVVSLILLFLGIYVLAAANHRYRVPLLPLFALYVGPLAYGHVARARTLVSRRVGAGVSLALFGAICVAGLAVDPAFLRARPGANVPAEQD